jgi:hypothetical protein
MTSISQEWEDKHQCLVYAEDKETGEVYRCNPQKAIADIYSLNKIMSQAQAEETLLASDVDHPIDLGVSLMWVENK